MEEFFVLIFFKQNECSAKLGLNSVIAAVLTGSLLEKSDWSGHNDSKGGK